MTALDPDESEIEASRAPLLEHLVELRNRLIVSVVAIAVAFVVCFAFAQQIYVALLQPYVLAGSLAQAAKTTAGGGHGPFDLIQAMIGQREVPKLGAEQLRLIYTGPLEFFFTKMKLAVFGAICLSFPVIAWQLYRFVAPGLYRRERRAFLPFLLASPVLFCLGAAMVYYVMLPFIMYFSLSQQLVTPEVAVDLLPKVSDYLTLVTTLLLAFGLTFQLPVVVTLLGQAGIVSSGQLREGRRYAIVGVFVVAAIVTPPDPISQLMLAIPIVVLYEISIWCVRLIEAGRKRQESRALTAG